MSYPVYRPAMTFKEIAAVIGGNELQVKQMFHRGMRKLKKLPLEAFFPVMDAADAQRAVIDRIEDWKTYGEGFEED